MNIDIRLSVGFFDHPKIIKLERQLGLEGVTALLRLWLWAAQNRPSGMLSGMDGEDIEIAARWKGDKAEVEAGKVLDAIGRHGSYASVVFDDAVTQAVIVQAYGGWVKLCQACGVEESESWFRKNFAKTWAAYSRQGVKQSGHLPGLFEITNSGNGYHEHIDPPKLVGDPAKARAVLEAGKSLLTLTEGQDAIRGEIRALSNLMRVESPEQ